MRKILIAFVLLFITQSQVINNDTHPIFLVKDEKTAIKVAKAIWKPLYGKVINKSRPFVASLENDSIWVVKGTLPKGRKGGVPYIEINAYNCQIYDVHHGK